MGVDTGIQLHFFLCGFQQLFQSPSGQSPLVREREMVSTRGPGHQLHIHRITRGWREGGKEGGREGGREGRREGEKERGWVREGGRKVFPHVQCHV